MWNIENKYINIYIHNFAQDTGKKRKSKSNFKILWYVNILYYYDDILNVLCTLMFLKLFKKFFKLKPCSVKLCNYTYFDISERLKSNLKYLFKIGKKMLLLQGYFECSPYA